MEIGSCLVLLGILGLASAQPLWPGAVYDTVPAVTVCETVTPVYEAPFYLGLGGLSTVCETVPNLVSGYGYGGYNGYNGYNGNNGYNGFNGYSHPGYGGLSNSNAFGIGTFCDNVATLGGGVYGRLGYGGLGYGGLGAGVLGIL